MQDLAQLGARIGNGEAQGRQAGEEAVEVVVQAEERALPGAGDVVGGVGAREAPVEQRDLAFGQRRVRAVDEDAAAVELADCRPGWNGHGVAP